MRQGESGVSSVRVSGSVSSRRERGPGAGP